MIVDAEGVEVATFRTEHEGRGRFGFTPQAGGAYTLKINEPSGIKTTYPLPEVKAAGGVLASPADRYERSGTIKLSVAATAQGAYRVALRKRESEVASEDVELEAGKATDVELTPPASADGVLIATLWDAEGKPLAERLVYRQPAEQVNVQIEADRESYVPGGTARLKIRTTDADGQPVGAVVGLTVTDESVLEMIETREQAPRLPVMVLLEGDVRELADAHIYLDESNDEAPRAVDLLLGTQGWRRFAFIDAPKFLAAHGDAAKRVLALRMATGPWGFKGGPAAGLAGAFGDDGFAQPEGAAAGADPNDAPQQDGAVPPRAAPPVPEAPPGHAQGDDQGQGQPADPVGADGPPAEPGDRPVRGGQQAAGQAAAAERPALRPQAPKEGQERADLRQAGERAKIAANARRIIAGDLADEDALIAVENDFIVVREYAHRVRTGRQPGRRVDFTETLYWSVAVATNEATGEASVEFGLSDSVTAFRVLADAFTKTGALAEATDSIEVVEPFYVEPKLPLEVTSGDVVKLPIGIVNATGQRLDTKLIVRAAGGQAGGFPRFNLGADERLRRLFTVEVSGFSGPTQFSFEGKAGPYANTVVRPLNVVPLGFPIELAHGGLVDGANPAQHQIVISDEVVAGSLSAKVSVFPTPLANMTAALERLLQEPYGCFEQTSSSTYPLVMAQQYFKSHHGR